MARILCRRFPKWKALMHHARASDFHGRPGMARLWMHARQPEFPVMKLVILAILTGLASGLLGALCGVGGGIIMVPAFVGLLGLEHKQAVATSMAVIIVTAIAATINNSRANNLIDWKIVAAVGLASALAAWFGSDLMRGLSNQTLTRIFGVVLVVFGLRMLWKS
jgi:uncharacterized membrane protein YfcA